MNPREITWRLRMQDEASRVMDRFQKHVERRSRQISRNLEQAGRQFMTITAGIAAVAGSILLSANATATYADEIDKMSQRTQLGTEFLQEMRFVNDQVGVSFESIERTMDSFVRRIPQLEQGTSESARAWRQLGINLHDAEGNLRSTGDLYPEMIRRLAAMENETQRNVIATQLLGRGASELIPLLNLTSEELEELTGRAHEIGAVMDQESIAAAVKFKDSVAELKQEFSAIAREAGMSFIPMLQESILPLIRDHVIPMLRRGIEFVVSMTESFSRMPSGTQAAVIGIVAFTAALGPMLMGLSRLVALLPLITAGFHAMLGPLGLVTAAIGLVVYHTVRANNRANEYNRTLLEQKHRIDGLAESYKTMTEAQLRQAMAEVSVELMKMQQRIRELDEAKRMGHGLDAARAFELMVLKERSKEYTEVLIKMGRQLKEIENADPFKNLRDEAPAGTLAAMRDRLSELQNELNRLPLGTREFERTQIAIERLRKEIEELSKTSPERFGESVKRTIENLKEALESDIGRAGSMMDAMFAVDEEHVEQVKQQIRLLNELRTLEFRTAKEEEIAILDEWYVRAVEMAHENEELITRAREIHARERAAIERRYFEQSMREWVSVASQAINVLTMMSQNRAQGEIQRIEQARDAEIERLDRQIAAETDNEQKRAQLISQREAAERRFADRIREERRRAFIAQKRAAVLESIMQTALAVVQALPNIPLSIAVGAIGAAQTATIASQPVPRFAHGVDNFRGGAAIVGERGPELAVFPPGTNVITNENLQRMTQGGSQSTQITNNFHFHGPVARDSEEWIKDTVQKGMRKAGAGTPDRYFVNRSAELVL